MRKFAAALLLSVLAVAGCSTGVVISDSITPAGPVALDAGQSVTLTAAVVGDSSNAGVTWSLVGAGTLSAQTTTTVVYTAPAPVSAAASAVVTAIPVKNALYAAATQINFGQAPVITSATLPTATLGSAYTFQLGATGGTAPLTFTLVTGTLPAGLTLSSTGLISGTPTALGSSALTFQVADSAATPGSSRTTLTLNVVATTLAVATVSAPNGVTGATYSVTLTATGGAQPYIWSVASGTLPAGLTLSTAGVLSGVPSAAGTYNFTAKVVDSEPSPQSATKAFNVTIFQALAITTTSLPGGSLKNAYTTTLAFSGGTLPVTWKLAAGTLPAGLTLSTAGVISGTPTAAGTSSFTVQITDSSSPAQTATATLSITIVSSTLAITTTSLPAATVTAPYSTTLQSSGGNPPVMWSVVAGALPAGLTLSTAGVISGTPSGAGTSSFTVQATDSTPFSVTQALTLTVNNLATLTIATTTLPAGNIGTAYSSTLTAMGGASPYTWSVASGALPPGLTLSAAGVLSGTPLAAGTYNVTIQVKDSEATPATASRAFTITIGTTLPTGTANAELTGSYAFLLNGFAPGKAAGQVYGFGAIGSLTFSGTGTVTGVEDTNTTTGSQASVTVTGSYSVNTNNRGLLVLTAGTTTTVYAIAVSQFAAGVAQAMVLTEFDNASGTGNTATGFARHQTAAAFTAKTLAGVYAFGLSGESPCSTCATGVHLGPVAAAGLFTGDGTATLSAGQEDAAAYSTNYAGVTLAGSFTVPSASTGRGTLKLTPTGTIFAAPPTDYTYLIVSATEILLLSTDSHATTTLLFGDARMQQQATYSATSLSGRSIGYESQASGGDGATTLPVALNAILSELTITGSGTATLEQDANRAGTFANTPAAAVTYTTSATGRTAVATGGNTLVVYLYNTSAGFALDTAGTAAYPGAAQFELQTPATVYPVLLSGNYAGGTFANPVAATVTSGIDSFTLNNGGVNSAVSGALTTTTDSSSPAGALALGQTGSLLYLEDATARAVVTFTTTTTPTAVVYAITSTRAVSLPATGTTPTITVLQQ